MRFRHYILRAFNKNDVMNLEDKLHRYVHAENIVGSDRKLLPAPQQAASDSGTLYDVLKLNEFNVEYAHSKRLRYFPTFFGFGEPLPTHNVSALISGEEAPLIAIHHCIATTPTYIIDVAKDVTQAHWTAITKKYDSKKFLLGYEGRIKNILEGYEGIQMNTHQTELLGPYDKVFRNHLSFSGSIADILTLRKRLRAGFHGVGIASEILDFS